MKMKIKCKLPDMARCPRCACPINLSKDMRIGHCGRCGSVMDVEITKQIEAVPEDTKESFTQLSIF